MRRTRLAPIAAAAATLLALSACGGGGGKSKGISPTDALDHPLTSSITLWHGYTDVEAKALQTLVDQWNSDHPSGKVNAVFDGGNDSALQKTTAAFVAGNYPDVAYEYGSSTNNLASQSKLVDLTSLVKNTPDFNWNDFFEGERLASTVNGKVVGIPALQDNLALVYNKKLFEQAGVATPTNDWTWQDFRDAARKLTDSAAKQYGWAYVNDGSEDTVWRYVAMLWQGGGQILSSDNKSPAFDSPAGLQALQLLHDMAVTDKSVYLDTGNGDYLNLFNSGKIAMLWTGPWDLSSINSDVDYGVTYLPAPTGGTHQTISGPDVYMLFNHSTAATNTAWQFIKWFTSPEVDLQFSIATGDLPLRQSVTTLPDYQKFLDKYPGDKVFVDNLNNVKNARPNIANYPQISSAIGQAVQAVLLGKADPKSALDSAKSQVEGILAGSG